MFECDTCGKKASKWKRCDEHYRCDDCHTRDNLCFYREGLLCDLCHELRVIDRVIAFEGNTIGTDEVTCPHCGHIESDSWEFEDGEYECGDCGFSFQVERTVSVSYSTTAVMERAAAQGEAQ